MIAERLANQLFLRQGQRFGQARQHHGVTATEHHTIVRRGNHRAIAALADRSHADPHGVQGQLAQCFQYALLVQYGQ